MRLASVSGAASQARSVERGGRVEGVRPRSPTIRRDRENEWAAETRQAKSTNRLL